MCTCKLDPEFRSQHDFSSISTYRELVGIFKSLRAGGVMCELAMIWAMPG